VVKQWASGRQVPGPSKSCEGRFLKTISPRGNLSAKKKKNKKKKKKKKKPREKGSISKPTGWKEEMLKKDITHHMSVRLGGCTCLI